MSKHNQVAKVYNLLARAYAVALSLDAYDKRRLGDLIARLKVIIDDIEKLLNG